jgi:tetratricopeptide (TPR) repeat protein
MTTDRTTMGAVWQALLLALLAVSLVQGETSRTDRLAAGAAPKPRPAQKAQGGAAAPAEQGLKLYQQDRASLGAQRLLEQASIRFPQRHDVQLALLDSYLVRGNLKAAQALLQRLQPELDSNRRFAFDAIYFLLQDRQPALAEAQWSRVHAQLQARATQSSGPAARKELGEDLFVQGLLAAAAGQKNEAMQLLHQADQHGFPPLDSRQMLSLADTLYELREERLAVPTYLEFLKHWPQDDQARLHLALALQASEELAAAQQQLEHVLRDDPRFPGAHYYLGAVLFDMKRNDEAKVHLDEELKLNPKCYQCMAKLAHLAYLAGDDAGCESWLGKAMALDTEWGETNLVSGMLEIRAGKYVPAIKHLLKVLQQAPDNIQAHYQLQIAYQRIGDPENARVHADAFRKLTQEQKARSIRQDEP